MKLDALAFGAHVDDIELGCSATLAKLIRSGYKIGACELTAGEMSTRGTPRERDKEAEAAAKILGLETRLNLDIPDGNIEINYENRLKVIKVLRRYRPRFVFLVYWKCRHYDHIYTSKLVSEACFYSGLRKIDTGQDAFRPSFIFYYPLRQEFEPSFVVDVSDTWEIKMNAIQAHSSQFYNPESTEPETFISSKFFLDSIVNKMKYWGMRIGIEYGEPFLVKETLRVDDPLALFDSMDPSRVMTVRVPD
jgi:bacillithiol biosynthesis deacetylase BshB1